jgi:polyisoprenoid-binding protein YceI
MKGLMRYRLVPEQSQVWIDGSSSIHPIRATASGLEGWLEAEVTDGEVGPTVTGRVEIEVEQLRSGNRLVDRETRRRVDSRRHPAITGEITSSKQNDDGQLSVEGIIGFRGEELAVTGNLVVTPTDDGLRIEGEQSFDVRDWGLDPPALLAIKVHPDVTVRISLEAEPD